MSVIQSGPESTVIYSTHKPTACPWDELAEVKAFAVRFNFILTERVFTTCRTAMTKSALKISFSRLPSLSLIRPPHVNLCNRLFQTNMNILFSCDVTNEVVFFSLSLQKYSWMTSCWHTQSSWPQTSSSRSCFSSILSSRQNHKCQPLQFWNSSTGVRNPIIRWFIQLEHGPGSSSLDQCFY